MKRDLGAMGRTVHDVVVVGGGIYGACVAWDAAQRGLSVALVDQDDFGAATSANALKTLHGGLRYLQEASLPRMRLMIRERRTWQRIAPHLTRPLACVMPTGHKLTRQKLVMTVALAVNDCISFDRNHGLSPDQQLPSGRILSRAECLSLLPGLPTNGVSGGALWYDAQVIDSERLLLSLLISAAGHGAQFANYAQAVDLIKTGRRVQGVVVRDLLSGCDHTISARVVVNCAGGWIDSLLEMAGEPGLVRRFHLSTAINLITRQIIPDVAVGLPSRHAGSERILFVAPWQGTSLVGTWHQAHEGRAPDYRVDKATIESALAEVNAAYPAAALSLADVYHVHTGYLPMQPQGQGRRVKLVRESEVYDHAIQDNLAGLVSVLGVKYTTARHAAEQAVDLVLRKLGRAPVPCRTQTSPIAGFASDYSPECPPHRAGAAALDCAANLPHEVWGRIVRIYGADAPELLVHLADNPSLAQPVTPMSEVLQVEIIHGLRCEMAQTLADLIRRRTPLGAAGVPDRDVVMACARLAAEELGWNAEREAQEVNNLFASYEAANPLIRNENA